MFVIFLAESSKLCLKDLSDDVTREFIKKLKADEAALEKFYQYFGLKLGDRYPLKGRFPLHEIKTLFPDTTINVLKECFEVLQLYDLGEILEKVRPRSLRPAVSPEQIEKLRRADNRPTKYHSDVAVLVVDFTVEGDILETEDARKIETCFKDLNSWNELAIISSSQKTRNAVREIIEKNRRIMRRYRGEEEDVRGGLESVLEQKAVLEQALEEERKTRRQRWNELDLQRQLTVLEKEVLTYRNYLKKIAEAKKEAERITEKLKELTKEITKPISMALNKWIHNKGWLTSYTYIHVL